MNALPTAGQLAWQEAGFGLFCHFGINTFYGWEHSDGTLDPRGFEPSALDAGDWAAAAAEAGARYLVLTAKHHDGFCLWPTRTTDYSVRSSPWRSGRGDVVAEAARACAEHGLRFGLYLSPWDRNAACYDDAAAYDALYAAQLRELCTSYGPLFEIWFDGAGSEGRGYDWNSIMSVIDEHQSGAMVFNMGRPTIRWVGNEDGLASDPVTYAVADTASSMFTDERQVLDDVHYLPPECDVPIRRNWFWHPDDADTRKSLEHLLGVYYRSVGLGAGLLLNVPPDRRGLLDDDDRARLLELGAEVKRRFGAGTSARVERVDGEWVADFGRPTTFDHLVLGEELLRGQQITRHEVRLDGRVLAHGQTVGVRRFHAFEQVTGRYVRIRVEGSDEARLTSVTAHLTGLSAAPDLEPQLGMDNSKT